MSHHPIGGEMVQYLVIPGKPVPKARHQVRLYRGGVITYTPPKTREFEKAVRAYASHAGVRLQRGDLATILLFHSSHVADLSNLVKSLEDGLNGIAWDDDRQVKACVALKLPCERGQEKTEVAVMMLEEFMARFEEQIRAAVQEARAERKGVRRSG